jgi:hypothetical protein
MNYELKQYSFGETIGKTFNLYFNNFIALVFVSLLCQIPVALMAQFSGFVDMARGVTPVIEPGFFIKVGLYIIVAIMATPLITAWVIRLAARKFLEDSPLLERSRTDSVWSLILPIIGLSFLIGLFTMLWSLLLIVPGIIAALSYSVATAVLVLEKQTIRQAIKRSKSLTKGRKGRILGLVIVVGIITVCITKPLGLLIQFMGLPTLVVYYLNIVISALTTPIQSCLLVVIYFNLRIEKEGFNIEHLAQQFSLADTAKPAQGPTLEA